MSTGKYQQLGDLPDGSLTRAEVRVLLNEIERLRAIVDRIPPDRLNPWHTVTVHATGWHMAHPIDCNLSACPFDGLAQAEWAEPPTAEGVWRWHSFEDQPWEWQEE